MSSKRYTEEFKIEAVKQVTERGYSVEKLDQLVRPNLRWNRFYLTMLFNPCPGDNEKVCAESLVISYIPSYQNKQN